MCAVSICMVLVDTHVHVEVLIANVLAQVPWRVEQEVFTIKLSRARLKVSMAQRQGCNVSVVRSHQANVTVNSQDHVAPVTPAIVTIPNLPRHGHVSITPLANFTSLKTPEQSHELQSMSHQATDQAEYIGSKLLLKAVCMSTKQSAKTFILRGVDIARVNSQNQLKRS